MALAFYGTEPGNDIEADEIILETDLHGKLSSLLVTLLETGAVKYKEGEDALVFFDSRATVIKNVYTR
jgi:hypothetical protein